MYKFCYLQLGCCKFQVSVNTCTVTKGKDLEVSRSGVERLQFAAF